MNARLQIKLHRAGLAPRPASAVPTRSPVHTVRPAPAPRATVYGDPYITPAQRRPSRRFIAAAVAVLAAVVALAVVVIR